MPLFVPLTIRSPVTVIVPVAVPVMEPVPSIVRSPPMLTIDAALLTVKTAVELMLTSSLKVFVPAPTENVPVVSVVIPETFNVAGGVKFPRVCVNVPLIVIVVVEPPVVSVCPAVLLITTLLNVLVAVVPSTCADAPSNVIVPDPGVNVVPVASDQLPATLMVVGAVNDPSVKVNTPSIFKSVVLPPVATVPTELLMIRL